MDLVEQKQYIKEFKELNRQTRTIIKKMSEASDHQTFLKLQNELDALQPRLDELTQIAKTIIDENENPPKNIMTPLQAQFIYDAIRQKIRLAKFKDSGIELPDINVKKLFHGRKIANVQDITNQIQDIINRWEPVTD